MSFKLKFETDGAAFENCSQGEVRRILENVILGLDDYIDSDDVRDLNGNKIGYYKMVIA